MSLSDPRVPDPHLLGKARLTDPRPSWWAAGLMDDKQQLVVKHTIVAILRAYGPLTHEGIHDHYIDAGGRRTQQRIRTATKELVDEGVVEQADGMGETKWGGPSTLWQAIE